MDKIKAIATIVLLFFISGCTSVSMYTPESQVYKEAIQFKPEQDKAKIYIYRLDGDYSGYIYDLNVNGQKIKIRKNSFISLSLKPGEHQLIAPKTSTFGSTAKVKREFEKGKIYYYEMEFSSRIAIPDKTFLHERDETEAKNAISGNLYLIDLSSQKLNPDATKLK